MLFHIKSQSPLPRHDPGNLGKTKTLGKGKVHNGRIYISSNLYFSLHYGLELSREKEEAGFILGKVFQFPDKTPLEKECHLNWWIMATDFLLAKRTDNYATQVIFTGDTWSALLYSLKHEFPSLRLVGWFHTHTFSATDGLGLSGLDQDLHRWFMPAPWLIALLLNIEKGKARTVHCYQRGPELDLLESPFEIFKTN